MTNRRRGRKAIIISQTHRAVIKPGGETTYEATVWLHEGAQPRGEGALDQIRLTCRTWGELIECVEVWIAAALHAYGYEEEEMQVLMRLRQLELEWGSQGPF